MFELNNVQMSADLVAQNHNRQKLHKLDGKVKTEKVSNVSAKVTDYRKVSFKVLLHNLE